MHMKDRVYFRKKVAELELVRSYQTLDSNFSVIHLIQL